MEIKFLSDIPTNPYIYQIRAVRHEDWDEVWQDYLNSRDVNAFSQEELKLYVKELENNPHWDMILITPQSEEEYDEENQEAWERFLDSNRGLQPETDPRRIAD